MSDTPGPTELAPPPTRPPASPPPPPQPPPPLHPPQPAPTDAADFAAAPPTRPPRQRSVVPILAPAALGWLLLASVLGDIGLRSDIAALSSAIAVIIVAGPILGAHARRSRSSHLFLLLAVTFALWLPVRASTWLTAINAVVVVSCLAVAAIAVRPFAWRWSTDAVGSAVARIFLAPLFGRVLLASFRPLADNRLHRATPILRGIAIAVVPIAVLTALLASADAVFAESITTGIDPSSAISHLILIAVVAAAIGGLVAVAGVPGDERFNEHRPLGAIEALILLGAVFALYAGFAIVQVVSAFGGADRILAERGVSYAEYARAGFFQLLWVAGLTAALLGLVRLLVATGSPRLDRAVRIVGALVALLTTAIVAVAMLRLGLYTDEFGQTNLRWYCTAFAWMLGVAFVAIAAGHVPQLQRHVPKALLAIVVGTLFAVNVLNPEARVAEHNLNRADAADQLDAEYLARLSADAWPVLLEHESLMQSLLTGRLGFDARCLIADKPNGFGPLGFNLALHRLNC